MVDGSDTEEEETSDTETDSAETVGDDVVNEEVVIDLDSAEEYEQRIETLEEELSEQREEVEELKALMLDLSTRVADGRDMGVCPECHGPVMKKTRWLRTNTIECTQCGEVFHEY